MYFFNNFMEYVMSPINDISLFRRKFSDIEICVHVFIHWHIRICLKRISLDIMLSFQQIVLNHVGLGLDWPKVYKWVPISLRHWTHSPSSATTSPVFLLHPVLYMWKIKLCVNKLICWVYQLIKCAFVNITLTDYWLHDFSRLFKLQIHTRVDVCQLQFSLKYPARWRNQHGLPTRFCTK